MVSKTVFLDVNGNGIKDAGELSAVTNSSGVYTITGIGPGSYTPVLQLPANTLQTSASPPAFTATSGMNVSSGYDIGMFTQGSITGTIYNDTNANGTKDTGETGLSGKTVYIDTNNNGALDMGEPNTQTSGSGTYSFSNLGPGTYQVRSVVPAGTTQTSSDPSLITMTSAQLASNTNIGFYIGSTISGSVYNDVSGNGTKDGGDLGLAGITVYFDVNNNGLLDTGEQSATTDSNGNYSFTQLPPGTYRTRIVLPSGDQQTSSQPANITPTSGATNTFNFGLFAEGWMSGTVFSDSDGDATFDAGEPGMSGITVYLDSNANSKFDVGEPSAVTDASGNWAIGSLGPGAYRAADCHADW